MHHIGNTLIFYFLFLILQESDAGTTMFFACNVGPHCTGGGMGFSVTVNAMDAGTPAPTATAPTEVSDTPAPSPAPVGKTIPIDPWGFEDYADLTAEVGDEIVFVWEKYVERTKAIYIHIYIYTYILN